MAKMAKWWVELTKATEEHCKTRWSGGPPGLRFRCGLCGYRFKPGDLWRGVMANVKGSPTKHGNFLVCKNCLDRCGSDTAMLNERSDFEDELEKLSGLGLFMDRAQWERRNT